MVKHCITALFLFLAACRHTPSLLVFNNMESAKRNAAASHTRIFAIFDLWGSSTPYVDRILEDADIRSALGAYTVVRLRCDDRTRLNDTLTLGTWNADFQIRLTGASYQPMFCVLDAQGNLLKSPLHYAKPEILLRYISANAQ